jgi:hypothetical protein
MTTLKRLLALLLLSAITLLFFGCANGGNETLNIALEGIKEPLRLMDERYALYADTLEAARLYVENPTEDSLNAAKSACAQATTAISALPTAQSTLSEEDKAKMTEIGLNIADYSVPIEFEAYSRQDCLLSISMLAYYLDIAPEQDEVLKKTVDIFTEVNDVLRQVDYLCINELFCQFSGKEIDAFAGEFLQSLSALSADHLPWETDSVALEAKANKLMNDADASLALYAEYIGEQYYEMMENS